MVHKVFMEQVGASIRCSHRVSVTGNYKVLKMTECIELIWSRCRTLRSTLSIYIRTYKYDLTFRTFRNSQENGSKQHDGEVWLHIDSRWFGWSTDANNFGPKACLKCWVTEACQHIHNNSAGGRGRGEGGGGRVGWRTTIQTGLLQFQDFWLLLDSYMELFSLFALFWVQQLSYKVSYQLRDT